MENKNLKQNLKDEDLVLLSLQNEDDFLFLMKRYEKKLLNYIFKISDFSHDEAEDILQEVFIKVFKNLNDFDLDMKFSSWIYRITRNQTISHFRKNKNLFNNLTSEENDYFLNNIESEIDLEKEIDQRIILKSNLKIILSNLDYKYREALILRFLEEKEYKEISEILEKPIGTVATLIRRSKDKFIKEAKKTNIEF
jgi:RNA polymerase sigma-70 factor, ECF subfamily